MDSVCIIGDTSNARRLVEILSDRLTIKLLPDFHTLAPGTRLAHNVFIICNTITHASLLDIKRTCTCTQAVFIVESVSQTIGFIDKIKDMVPALVYAPPRTDYARVQEPLGSIPRFYHATSAYAEGVFLRIYAPFFSDLRPCAHAKEIEAAGVLEQYFEIVNRALVNEFADYCDTEGVCVYSAIDMASTKPYDFVPFYPSVGVHALPCARKEVHVLESACTTLYHRPRVVLDKIVKYFAGGNYDSLRYTHLLVVGVGSKPGSEDCAHSPILDIVHMLRMDGAKVDIYDPFIRKYDRMPTLSDPCTGKRTFHGIVVFHPYLIDTWKEYGRDTLYFCRVTR